MLPDLSHLATPQAEEAISRYGHLLNRPGFVAQASRGEVKVVPWWQSSVKGHGAMAPRDRNIPVPERVLQHMKDTLPPLRRRTPEERLKYMTDVLIEDATQAYKVTGIPVLSESVVTDICRVFAFEYGRFISPESVKRMTLEQIRPLLEAKAKRDFIAAGHKQAESDQHKVVLDWHGHRNDVITRARSQAANN